jgi:hypothetical protein
VFRPAGDLAANAELVEFAAQLALDVLDVLLALGSLGLEPPGDALVVVCGTEAEREVLQLPLELPDAEAVGERCVDFLGFERGATQLGFGRGLHRAHAHELQRQPDQHQPHVGRESEQQLAQSLGLLGLQVLARVPFGGNAAVADAFELAGEPQGRFAEDFERPGFVDEPSLAQRREQRREQHVVVGLQLGECGHQVDAAQGVFARRERTDHLERGAHFR